jgi:hypothetical protein
MLFCSGWQGGRRQLRRQISPRDDNPKGQTKEQKALDLGAGEKNCAPILMEAVAAILPPHQDRFI